MGVDGRVRQSEIFHNPQLEIRDLSQKNFLDSYEGEVVLRGLTALIVVEKIN
jgi:hypothetical protein